jgi:oligosaccharide repeat unit polymerase
MRNKIKLGNNLLIMLSSIAVGISFFAIYSRQYDFIFWCIFTIFILNIFYSIYYKNPASFLLLATFFILLLGRIFMYYFNLTENSWRLSFTKYIFNDNISLHIFNALIIALIGFLIANILNTEEKDIKIKYNIIKDYPKYYEYIFMFGYLLTIVASLYVNYSKFKYTLAYGYFEYFVSYKKNVTGIMFIMEVAAEINFFFFAFYLSFTKKINIFIIILFIFDSIFSSFYGSRSNFVLNILTLLWYYFFVKKNFNYKTILSLLFIGLFFGIISSIISINRSKGSYADIGIIELISKFFYGQSVSLTVIGHQKEYENFIPHNGMYYLFYYQIKSFLNIFNIGQSFEGNSMEAINNGPIHHFLAHKVLGMRYLVGEGTGSSYIAECYYAAGYIGIFIGSFLLMKIASIIKKFANKKHPFLLGFFIIMINGLFYTPRGTYFTFIRSIFTVRMFIFLIIIIIIASIIKYAKLYNRQDLN